MKLSEIRKNYLSINLAFIGLIFLCLGLLPLYPKLSWYINPPSEVNVEVTPDVAEAEAAELPAPAKDGATSTTMSNSIPMIIIPSIGVNMAIITDETDEQAAFARGAWLLPGTANPDGTVGNAVIAAHRYLYTSGPNTFYHLDKLKIGDRVLINWQDRDYTYTVRETKIVDPSDVGILSQTDTPILTLFTCHPVYTTKSRWVVVAELST